MSDSNVKDLSLYAQMRDPLQCIDVRVYDGSKLYAQQATIADLDEEFEPALFLRQICTGEPPAEMTIYDLLMENYPWACEEGQHLQVAIWTTTEEGSSPDAVVHVKYRAKHKNFDVLQTYISKD
jgi:hypothetical protein